MDMNWKIDPWETKEPTYPDEADHVRIRVIIEGGSDMCSTISDSDFSLLAIKVADPAEQDKWMSFGGNPEMRVRIRSITAIVVNWGRQTERPAE